MLTCVIYLVFCYAVFFHHSVRDFEEGPMKAVQSLMSKRRKIREHRSKLEVQTKIITTINLVTTSTRHNGSLYMFGLSTSLMLREHATIPQVLD